MDSRKSTLSEEAAYRQEMSTSSNLTHIVEEPSIIYKSPTVSNSNNNEPSKSTYKPTQLTLHIHPSRLCNA